MEGHGSIFEARCEGILPAPEIASAPFLEHTTLSHGFLNHDAGMLCIQRLLLPLLADAENILTIGPDSALALPYLTSARRFALFPGKHRGQLERLPLTIPESLSSACQLCTGNMDVILLVHFLEHLPERNAINAYLSACFTCLRPGGRLVLLQPDIRLSKDKYWDFIGHNIPLTRRSITDLLLNIGFIVERSSVPHGTGLWTFLTRKWHSLAGLALIVARKPEVRE